MAARYNFNPGPAGLPSAVMRQAMAEFTNYHDLGYGIMEASHRAPEFEEIINQAESNIRQLMAIPDDYAVLFLQGGASTQFSMIPMNFLTSETSADYSLTGTWSEKALAEAKLYGKTRVIATSRDSHYDRIPAPDQWAYDAEARYLHITSNNTIYGTQYHVFPKSSGIPLVADMSSDIMSRQIAINNYAMIYAGAQKNLGPSGVTLVIVHKNFAASATGKLPTMMKYSTYINHASLYNTPPTFSIYMLRLVTDWILGIGGLKAIEKLNQDKAALLYATIDADDFYRCPAQVESRSLMNVCFRLPNEELENQFALEAVKAGMIGLPGHRSVGGFRASLYNAMTIDGVRALTDLMLDFKRRMG